MPWTVEVTAEAEGEIKELPADLQAKFLHVSGLLEKFGPEKVHEPHVKHIEGKLWEIRMRGKDGIARAIYFTTAGRRALVVRVFTKKTQQTPRREIDLATKRMRQLTSELGRKNRKRKP